MPASLSRLLSVLLLAAFAAASVHAQNVIEGRADSVAMRAFGTESIRQFQNAEKRRLKLTALSTVSAIEAVAKGQVEIALTARGVHALKPDETGLTFHPVAWESLVMVTHPGNPTPSLSLRQLRDIYLGKILRWDEVGGPPRPINLYAVAGPLDGAEYGLRRALFGAGHRPVAASRWYLNTEQLEAAVAIDPNALGVTGFSNVVANRKLRMIPVEGVTPSLKTLRSGEYLLATPLFVVHRGNPAPTENAARYIRFLESAGAAPWLQKRMLLPIAEASLLNANFAIREQRLLELLKRDPATPTANATPVATAPATAPATPAPAPTAPKKKKKGGGT